MIKNIISALVFLCASIGTLAISKPANAQFVQSSIGPSVAFGSGQTSIGIDSKFGVSNNISVRPFIYFPNGGTDFGAALTYDFNFTSNGDYYSDGLRQRSLFTPFVGASIDVNTSDRNSTTTVGLVGGADFALTDSLQLKGAIIIPLTNDRGQNTTFTVGAGFRF
jgi:hypothetical protein